MARNKQAFSIEDILGNRDQMPRPLDAGVLTDPTDPGLSGQVVGGPAQGAPVEANLGGDPGNVSINLPEPPVPTNLGGGGAPPQVDPGTPPPPISTPLPPPLPAGPVPNVEITDPPPDPTPVPLAPPPPLTATGLPTFKAGGGVSKALRTPTFRNDRTVGGTAQDAIMTGISNVFGPGIPANQAPIPSGLAGDAAAGDSGALSDEELLKAMARGRARR